ncbi:MAG: protein jag [Gorillibacterium sp.]|nr:protein jag [Gorillibacterium sp.]
MKKIVVTAKTIEEAVKQGILQLNTTKDRVKITVLEQPTKGLLGIFGVKPAKVELEKVPDAYEEVELFLLDVFRTMALDVKIEQITNGDGTLINLTGPELGILIGRRGQTLDALQYLVNIVANRYSTSHIRVILDAEKFRERRMKTLEDLSSRLAQRVIKTRKEVILEPMPAQERKIIHAHLQNHSAVKTYSKGDEPNRRIVIAVR